MSQSRQKWVGIEACDCLTSFGDSETSCDALLADKIALAPTPVLGKDGGDLVPLAYSDGYDETIPPRWESKIDQLFAKVPDAPWGSPGYPVFLTSSNYDVGSLYSYKATQNKDFLKIGTPANTLEYLKKRFGWGPNAIALSHACVTAHVGIELATRHLKLAKAKKALVFSFDYISPFVSGGFHALKILNEYFPAPYEDREIGSIGLGDGCGFTVLSNELQDFNIEDSFLYNEMYHFTSNDPSGSGFKQAAEWLKATTQDRKTWIKGHGTGTLDAGKMEADAFSTVLPETPIVSWKGSLGHTLGSCGIVELAIALRAIEKGIAPGTVGTKGPTISPTVAKSSFSIKEHDSVALFSNAFGGAHAGCVISHA